MTRLLRVSPSTWRPRGRNASKSRFESDENAFNRLWLAADPARLAGGMHRRPEVRKAGSAVRACVQRAAAGQVSGSGRLENGTAKRCPASGRLVDSVQ